MSRHNQMLGLKDDELQSSEIHGADDFHLKLRSRDRLTLLTYLVLSRVRAPLDVARSANATLLACLAFAASLYIFY